MSLRAIRKSQTPECSAEVVWPAKQGERPSLGSTVSLEGICIGGDHRAARRRAGRGRGGGFRCSRRCSDTNGQRSGWTSRWPPGPPRRPSGWPPWPRWPLGGRGGRGDRGRRGFVVVVVLAADQRCTGEAGYGNARSPQHRPSRQPAVPVQPSLMRVPLIPPRGGSFLSLDLLCQELPVKPRSLSRRAELSSEGPHARAWRSRYQVRGVVVGDADGHRGRPSARSLHRSRTRHGDRPFEASLSLTPPTVTVRAASRSESGAPNRSRSRAFLRWIRAWRSRAFLRCPRRRRGDLRPD